MAGAMGRYLNPSGVVVDFHNGANPGWSYDTARSFGSLRKVEQWAERPATTM